MKNGFEVLERWIQSQMGCMEKNHIHARRGRILLSITYGGPIPRKIRRKALRLDQKLFVPQKGQVNDLELLSLSRDLISLGHVLLV